MDHPQLPSFVSANPITVSQDQSIEHALALIERTGIGCLLVVDQDGCLAGVLTGKDLVMKVLAKKRDPKTTLVEEIMTLNPTHLHTDREIDLLEASRALGRCHARRMPIVDEKRRPVGVVSLEDVLVEVGEILGSLRNAVSADVSVGRMKASQVYRSQNHS